MHAINQIGYIANGLLSESFNYITGSARDTELQVISGSLSGKLGELNIRLNQSFCYQERGICIATGIEGIPSGTTIFCTGTGQLGTSGFTGITVVEPPLGIEEEEILKEMYLRDYNTKQSQKSLRSIYAPESTDMTPVETNDWIELREGDTTIRRSALSTHNSAANRITISKEFRQLAEENTKKVDKLVYQYNLYGAQPRQVAGLDADDIDPTGQNIVSDKYFFKI